MRILPFIIALGLLIAAPLQAFADANIFACEPEWESLAKEIGKDKVKVKTATSAFADPHHIRARPSLIAAIRQSDLVICSGNDLEVGWLPLLLERAKSSVQTGQVGNLMAADYVEKLGVPKVLDRIHGDVHPEGNPHVHLNPHNIALVAFELTKRLKAVDANNATFYQANYNAFSKRWKEAIKRWEFEAANLKGASVIVHHKSFTYLLDWLGINEVSSLEPKPGLPPTASHLEGLLQTLKEHPTKAIIRTPYDQSNASLWLSKKTGLKAIILPFTVGGDDKSSDLFGLFDSTIELLGDVNND